MIKKWNKPRICLYEGRWVAFISTPNKVKENEYNFDARMYCQKKNIREKRYGIGR